MRAEARGSGGYGHYYGDIHNHNGLGYGKGSLERSLEIAREHLDFFAFTGHSSWHDMVPMGPFPQESALWHRLVPRQALLHRGSFSYPVEREKGYAYLRARQRNGHLGWASPIYYTRREQ